VQHAGAELKAGMKRGLLDSDSIQDNVLGDLRGWDLQNILFFIIFYLFIFCFSCNHTKILNYSCYISSVIPSCVVK